MKPEFITFTGADRHTDITEMQILARQYSIEWGILLSRSKRGTARYPDLQFVSQLNSYPDLRKSAHICGIWSQDLLCWGQCPDIEPYLSSFGRCQVNTRNWLRPMSIKRANAWAQSMGMTTIFQCRSAFPVDESVQWLYDISGGRGILPDAWPSHPGGDVLVGYAGGLRPENVADVVSRLQGRYWIDLETGVRDANDRFSLSLCRQVCEIVYG